MNEISLHLQPELIVRNTLGDMTKMISDRLDYLMVEFETLNLKMIALSVKHIKDAVSKEEGDIINNMLIIFEELQAMGKIVRHRYPRYKKLFNALGVMATEREHGTLASSFRCIPGQRVNFDSTQPLELAYTPEGIKDMQQVDKK
jgi:hypothetical protein